MVKEHPDLGEWVEVRLSGAIYRRKVSKCSDWTDSKGVRHPGCGEIIIWRHYKTDPDYPGKDGRSVRNFPLEYPSLQVHQCPFRNQQKTNTSGPSNNTTQTPNIANFIGQVQSIYNELVDKMRELKEVLDKFGSL
jgi:hypothetical protein